MTPNETALSLDDTIRAEGQPLGRFNWVPETSNLAGAPRLDYGDWLPDPDGTHDGFIWRGGFYTLARQQSPAHPTMGAPTRPLSPTPAWVGGPHRPQNVPAPDACPVLRSVPGGGHTTEVAS